MSIATPAANAQAERNTANHREYSPAESRSQPSHNPSANIRNIEVKLVAIITAVKVATPM